MTKEQARTLIGSLTTEEKKALLQLLRNLDVVKDTAAAYQAGLRAGRAIREGR